jgi:hypothetical protein
MNRKGFYKFKGSRVKGKSFSFFMFLSKLKKAHDPSISIWILNDSTGVVDVINLLKLLRSEVDKASPLLLQSFDLSTLYTKIRPNGSKSLY